ncbi:MAG: alpha/beta hydrolase fold domain-containing protein, partial [Rubrimonas sp.]
APQMAAILARLKAEDAGLPDPVDLPPEGGRAQFAAVAARWNVDPPAMAEARTVEGPGVRGELRIPHGARPGLIVHVHGGGWCFGAPETHERAARTLAAEAGLAVLSVRYRLAPEHPFPAGLDDVAAAWAAVRAAPAAFAAGDGPVGIAGDSAGANLALALCLRAQADALPAPAFAALFYGVFDADFETASHRAPGVGYGLTRARMMAYWDRYMPDPAARENPLASPLKADDAALAALPPLWMNAADLDPLRDDALRLRDRLRALGREDPFVLHPGVIHGFMQMTAELEEARRAFALAGAWIRERT